MKKNVWEIIKKLDKEKLIPIAQFYLFEKYGEEFSPVRCNVPPIDELVVCTFKVNNGVKKSLKISVGCGF